MNKSRKQIQNVDIKTNNVDKVIMINPKHTKVGDLLYFVRQAQEKLLDPAVSNHSGVKDITRAGLIKDLIVADFLSHLVIDSKKDSSACGLLNHEVKYQYYHAVEGNKCQIDRLYTTDRLKDNTMFYLNFFDSENPLNLKRIYEILPDKFLNLVQIELDKVKQAGKDELHFAIGEDQCKFIGKLLYDVDSVFND